ncbi:ATP-dependent DNA helicase RecG [Candidatus Saccharibacteria bacterium]|nr:MAG: ATP-dependent DNA helicase RecG [Candidatus Saccharibacteria bacterium]PID99288.1 MAG: ATP-dependent DNA helicase RecG [Candidatus Saccharibacteria bacterium]
MRVKLTDPIESVNGVGATVAKGLRKLGIATVFDLVDYLPYRYEDYSQVLAVRDLRPGAVTVRAVVKHASGRYVRRGMHVTEALFSDQTGSVRAVWFNQPYRAAALKPGQEYYVSGQYELSRQRLQIMNPSAELVKDFPVNTARIVPVYRQSKTISSNQIRKLVAECVSSLRTLPETLPKWTVSDCTLLPRAQAIEAMHFPQSSEQLAAARRRLGFEEVFELSLAALLNKQESLREHALSIPFDLELARTFVSALPFKLTDDQRKVVWQAYQDMEHRYPMNRLVEGDVGSGKTVVAAMVALMAINQGYQVALMAPTELLARQHFETFQAHFRAAAQRKQIVLLAGGLSAREKKRAQERIVAGEVDIIIGTHALFQEAVDMHRLGLIIIDEQHRFGVEQRKALMAKAGHMPHVLSLTATPIPRSLALTLYGELDISVLREKPAGRQPITTRIISRTRRSTLYEKVRSEIAAGRQVFVVCPSIRTQTAAETSKAAAEKVYAELSGKELAGYRLALLHGQLKPAEKDAVMQQFVRGELDALVATTVVEVGVDVPNASVMVIESAEQFGLAQLHQLRGRVGRGSQESSCYLVLSDDKPPTKRLRAIESSQDGFRLAEYDLQLRGPGAIYGALQHGALDLRVVRLTDTALIAEARAAAQTFLERSENLLHYPELHERVDRLRRVTNLN